MTIKAAGPTIYISGSDAAKASCKYELNRIPSHTKECFANEVPVSFRKQQAISGSFTVPCYKINL